MKQKFIIAIALLLLACNASALTISINVKQSFKLGETISFDYTITSEKNQTIVYYPQVSCPQASAAMIEQKTIDLNANQPLNSNYSFLKVSNATEPQDCTATIAILSPAEQTESKKFSIIANPSFSITTETCSDKDCKQPEKVFVKNTEIHIVAIASVENQIVNASLTFPDKTTKQLSLPATIKAEQIGAYSLSVSATKTGYKNASDNLEFAVIEKSPVIVDVSACNSNGKCDAGETASNCPSDCNGTGQSNPEPEKKGEFPWLAVVGVIIAIVIIVFAYFKFFKKKPVE